MNKELVFKKEMRAFDINVDDIKPDEHIFGAIEEAIIKMRNECLIDRLEVVLNNNLIDIKDKITDNRTILGCRFSYADLSKDVSFIVRQDNEPTYEQLQKENKQLQEELEWTIGIVEHNRIISGKNKEIHQLKEKLDCDLQWAFKYEKQVDNWNKLKEYIKQEPTLYFYNDKLPFEVIIAKIINKMQELQGSNSNE